MRVALVTLTLLGGTFSKKRHRRPELSDRPLLQVRPLPSSSGQVQLTTLPPFFKKRLPKMKFLNPLGITLTLGSLSVP